MVHIPPRPTARHWKQPSFQILSPSPRRFGTWPRNDVLLSAFVLVRPRSQTPFGNAVWGNSVSRALGISGKQSFRESGSQTEFGNQGNSQVWIHHHGH